MTGSRVVVIGAGVGGLATAAVLARAGMDVTVLEAQVYPGGCASTFYHQGYRFDAGATLAGGFYPGGPMDRVAEAVGLSAWPSMQPAQPAMIVHLPGSVQVALHDGDERWGIRQAAFGEDALRFFEWQERRADALWELALSIPPFPAQSAGDWRRLAQRGVDWALHRPLTALSLLPEAFQTVGDQLIGLPESLRLFVDGQLLISAQATSARANALYGASALDFARRGVVHLEGGMGAISQTLAAAVRKQGGKVLMRQEVTRIRFEGRRITGVETRRGDYFPADRVIANLPPHNIAKLVEEGGPSQLVISLQRQLGLPEDGWGAFVVYLGVDENKFSVENALHHQVLAGRPLGEGNSVFISISPEWDFERAPRGKRAVTISTHTRLGPWWQLYERDRGAYEDRKESYTQKVLQLAGQALPGLEAGGELVLPGTPVTFHRFTRRVQGWVGGFPQTSLGRTWGPQLTRQLWMVGDSIFPGQSTVATALGGLRVAEAVLRTSGQTRFVRQLGRPTLPGTEQRSQGEEVG